MNTPANSDLANSPNLQGATGVVYFAAPHTALIVVMCVLVGMAVMGTLWAVSRADAADRRARMAEARTEGFTRALIAHGIDPYPHVKGEAP